MAQNWCLKRLEHQGDLDICNTYHRCRYTIGRSALCSFQCLSQYVSRDHCDVFWESSTWKVVDRNSSNGTFVNDVKIVPRIPISLKEGDKLGLGTASVINSKCYIYQLVCKNMAQAENIPPSREENNFNARLNTTNAESMEGLLSVCTVLKKRGTDVDTSAPEPKRKCQQDKLYGGMMGTRVPSPKQVSNLPNSEDTSHNNPVLLNTIITISESSDDEIEDFRPKALSSVVERASATSETGTNKVLPLEQRVPNHTEEEQSESRSETTEVLSDNDQDILGQVTGIIEIAPNDDSVSLPIRDAEDADSDVVVYSQDNEVLELSDDENYFETIQPKKEPVDIEDSMLDVIEVSDNEDEVGEYLTNIQIKKEQMDLVEKEQEFKFIGVENASSWSFATESSSGDKMQDVMDEMENEENQEKKKAKEVHLDAIERPCAKNQLKKRSEAMEVDVVVNEREKRNQPEKEQLKNRSKNDVTDEGKNDQKWLQMSRKREEKQLEAERFKDLFRRGAIIKPSRMKIPTSRTSIKSVEMSNGLPEVTLQDKGTKNLEASGSNFTKQRKTQVQDSGQPPVLNSRDALNDDTSNLPSGSWNLAYKLKTRIARVPSWEEPSARGNEPNCKAGTVHIKENGATIEDTRIASIPAVPQNARLLAKKRLPDPVSKKSCNGNLGKSGFLQLASSGKGKSIPGIQAKNANKQSGLCERVTDSWLAAARATRNLSKVQDRQDRDSSGLRVTYRSSSKNQGGRSGKLPSSYPKVPEIGQAAPKMPVKGILKNLAFAHDGCTKSVRIDFVPRICELDNANRFQMCSTAGSSSSSVQSTTSSNESVLGLDILIHDICKWHPNWLKEQSRSSKSCPPPVCGSVTLKDVKVSYSSYDDYFSTLYPLLLFELWSRVHRQWENRSTCPNQSQSWDIKVESTLIPDHSDKKEVAILQCRMKEEQGQNVYPRVGDLVVLTFKKSAVHDMKTKLLFGYIYNMKKTFISSEVGNKFTSPLFFVKVKHNLDFMSFEVKMRVVAYIRSDIRGLEALLALPKIPLSDVILKPSHATCSLPRPSDDVCLPVALNGSQRLAVLAAATMCLEKSLQPKICFIQGPPGTGKSHVIVALIMQILIKSANEVSSSYCYCKPAQILLCAPSNAAIDEIVVRLREEMKSCRNHEGVPCFQLVRMGQSGSMSPAVADVSMESYVKRALPSILNEKDRADFELERNSFLAKANQYCLKEQSSMDKGDIVCAEECRDKMKKYMLKVEEMEDILSGKKQPYIDFYREQELKTEIIEKSSVIATTINSCYTQPLKGLYGSGDNQFTCCIVDEASQCMEPEALVPLMLGITKMVLVGDPKQLPATVISPLARSKGLNKSLIYRLHEYFGRNNSPCHLLNLQYRMSEEIMRWPNAFFYDGKVKTATNMERKGPFVPYRLLNIGHGTETYKNGEITNEAEAQFVTALASAVFDDLIQNNLKLGIITPYNKQKYNIMKRLTDSVGHVRGDFMEYMQVNTVDSFQGQEKDVIVLSCVRAKQSASGSIGFLSNPERLNVALTRAKSSLIICGNFAHLQGYPMWQELVKDANNRRVVKNVMEDTWKNVEEVKKLVFSPQ